MIKRSIRRSVAEQKPYEVWNAFVDLIATESYTDLSPVQRVAHLSFWYDSEVQNGGHLQYFENRGTALLAETLASLAVLGADCQRSVLEAAAHQFLSRPRSRIETREEYVTTALADEFGGGDRAYYACEPPIDGLLAHYLEQHREDFVEIID